jgi:hypothetical protein
VPRSPDLIAFRAAARKWLALGVVIRHNGRSCESPPTSS